MVTNPSKHKILITLNYNTYHILNSAYTQPILKYYFLSRYTSMLVSEMITCISVYSSRGCSRPRFGSYTGSESFSLPSPARSPLSRQGQNRIFRVHVLLFRRFRHQETSVLSWYLRSRRWQSWYTSYSWSLLLQKLYVFMFSCKSCC